MVKSEFVQSLCNMHPNILHKDMGKIVEIAGLESTGKSYMAAQVAANALKMGLDVIYFDF